MYILGGFDGRRLNDMSGSWMGPDKDRCGNPYHSHHSIRCFGRTPPVALGGPNLRFTLSVFTMVFAIIHLNGIPQGFHGFHAETSGDVSACYFGFRYFTSKLSKIRDSESICFPMKKMTLFW